MASAATITFWTFAALLVGCAGPAPATGGVAMDGDSASVSGDVPYDTYVCGGDFSCGAAYHCKNSRCVEDLCDA
ncbi:MAG: hypothetical protein FJ100_20135, partial [Deltaproteobacteria bacterium]|nr:hypothetical protein [Deltaproteobacteria bacterium]